MTDPSLALATAALETQRWALGDLLERLRFIRTSAVPSAPIREWRGVAQGAYELHLAELVSRFDEAIASLQSASNDTEQALSTMANRVG